MQRVRTHRYGTAPSQEGDLHLPKDARPPVICLLHGGFWRLPYGRDQMIPLAEDLTRRGYAAWNLEYRRIGEECGGWPGTLQDVSAGIDQLAVLKDEGADLDLDRVVTVGHSAGGHLALWAAGTRKLAAGDPAPKVNVMAAAGQAPAADLERVYELDLSRGVAVEFLGGTPKGLPERYAFASPRALLPLGLPQLVVHGSDDDIVPASIGRDYAAAAREAGDPVDYVELPGTGHFEHLDPAGPAWAAVTAWLDRLFSHGSSHRTAQGIP
ncbi:MAG: alpha/beta hydrolase family protein [Myxococcales bacterium]